MRSISRQRTEQIRDAIDDARSVLKTLCDQYELQCHCLIGGYELGTNDDSLSFTGSCIGNLENMTPAKTIHFNGLLNDSLASLTKKVLHDMGYENEKRRNRDDHDGEL